jgi:hypothetical protein
MTNKTKQFFIHIFMALTVGITFSGLIIKNVVGFEVRIRGFSTWYFVRFQVRGLGILFIAYSIIGIIFKIPLFNNNISFKDFDSNFGIMHYIIFVLLALSGVFFLFYSLAPINLNS